MYESLIDSASKRYGVDKALLTRLIKTESSFNPHAVSEVGAMGLTQLMPDTAKELGVTDPFDPAQSIDGGAKHLSRLLKRYDGDEATAVAAYHAGAGNVDKGKIGPKTRSYVQKVSTHGMDESSRLQYEKDKAEYDAYLKDRQEYEAYLAEKQGGGAIKEGSAKRSISPGAAIGGVVGAVGGSVIGGPVGGAAGAVAGAAVGELAQQQYDRMTGSAFAPHSTEDALSRVGQEAGFAVVGEVGGAALRFIKPPMYAKPRLLTPEQQQTKAVLDRHGIPYTPDEITGGTFHTFARSVAENGTFSQQTMHEFYQRRVDLIKESARGIADTMGQQVPADVLGQNIVKHIRGEDDTLTQTVIDPLYNSVKNGLAYKSLPNGATQGGLLVNQKPVKDLFAKEVAEIERAAVSQNQPDLLKSPAYLSMKRFNGLPDSGQWADAYTVLKQVRQDLRELDNPLNVATATLNDKRVLGGVEKELTKQLEVALQSSPDPAHQPLLQTWQQAQKAVADRSQTFRNEIILRFAKAVDERGGEQGMKQFISGMTAEDLTKMLQATKSDPALQGSMRRSYLETKIEKVGGLEDANTPFNIERFRKEVFGATGLDRRKAEVLFDPTQRQKLKEFINAVSDMQDHPKSMLGKYLMLQSGGATFNIPLAAAGLFGLSAYNYGKGDTGTAAAELGGAVTILVGPKVLAGMLTDPRKVEYLIQGLRYSAVDNSQALRITRELIRLDQGFARAVQMGVSAYNAEQTSGPLHKTAESVKKQASSYLPQFGLGNFQQ